jgi:hypothetical protein
MRPPSSLRINERGRWQDQFATTLSRKKSLRRTMLAKTHHDAEDYDDLDNDAVIHRPDQHCQPSDGPRSIMART